MLRTDISTAIRETPDNIQAEIMAQSERTLALVNDNLPNDEKILLMSSAAPNWFKAKNANSLLVLTDRRLIFVAPAPQVLSWPLHSITKAQVLNGAGIVGFLIDVAGAEFQLGIDGGWGPEFEARVQQASAVATLRGI